MMTKMNGLSLRSRMASRGTTVTLVRESSVTLSCAYMPGFSFPVGSVGLTLTVNVRLRESPVGKMLVTDP